MFCVVGGLKREFLLHVKAQFYVKPQIFGRYDIASRKALAHLVRHAALRVRINAPSFPA